MSASSLPPSQPSDRIPCHAQGKVGDDLIEIRVSRSICGDIMDGVGIALERGGAMFIVAWADFERAYLENKALRERLPPPCKSLDEHFRRPPQPDQREQP